MGSSAYGISSVLWQDYDRIQLLVSVGRLSGESIADIISSINMQRHPNTEEVRVHTLKFGGRPEAHDEFIRRCTRGSFILVLSNGEAFFDTGVLTRLVERMRCMPLKGISGSAILYNADLTVSGTAEGAKAFFRRNTLLCRTKKPPKRAFFFGDVFRSDLNIVSVRAASAESPMQASESGDKAAKRMQHSLFAALNATAQMRIRALIGGIRNQTPGSREKTVWLIEQNILLIRVKQKKSSRRITDSDNALLTLLELLLESIRQNEDDNACRRVLERIDREADHRIRLVFFAQEFAVWPSMKSIYEYAWQNSMYSIQLVYLPFAHQNALTDHNRQMDVYRGAGYEPLRWDQYSVEKDSPDVAFLVKAYDMVPEGYCARDLERTIERLVFLSYGIKIPVPTPELDRLRYQLPIHYLSWLIVTDRYGSDMAAKKGYRGGSNCLQIGNARLDVVDELTPAPAFFNEIKSRAGKRKIIAWNTHHAIDDPNLRYGTFLQYGKQILDAFRDDPSVFLLWRPHPLFFSALRKTMSFTPEQEKDFWDRIESIENVIVDRNPSYHTAFSVSDALISDCSSMAVEFCFRQKPILMTVAPENDGFVHSTMRKAAEILGRSCGLTEFIRQVKEGTDTCRGWRMEFIEKELLYSDSWSVAEKLFDVLPKKMEEEEFEECSAPTEE